MDGDYVERAIRLSIEVDAPVEQVWQLWTTDEGVRSFFAPGSNVDARPDGAYEIFFAPDAEPGMRGADDMHVLAIQPPSFLSFTWNAPPSLPDVRGQRTHVSIRLTPRGATPRGVPPRGAEGTPVLLAHDGWGDGGQWDESYDYFFRAWGQVVLPRLKWRIENGSVDWSDPPELG